MWHADDGLGWWMLFGGVFWIVTLALIAYVFVTWLAPALRREGPSERERPLETPLEIAQRRYAGGEISRDEFERIRDGLRDGTRGAG